MRIVPEMGSRVVILRWEKNHRTKQVSLKIVLLMADRTNCLQTQLFLSVAVKICYAVFMKLHWYV